LMVGRIFFGEFERDVDADSFVFGIRVFHANVEPAVSADGFRRFCGSGLRESGDRREG